MPQTILVRGARQLLTLRGADGPRRGDQMRRLGVIADGSLLIRDGYVVEVGPTRRVENLAAARGALEINAAGRVVMPGFVDSDTRIAWAPPAILRSSSTARLEARARVIAAQMSRHGTTAFAARSGCGEDAVQELKILRAQKRLGDGPWDVVSILVPTREYEPAWLEKIKLRGLARLAASEPDLCILATRYNPLEPSTYSMQAIIALACRDEGLSPEEAITAATINGAHALGLGSRLGSLEPRKQADLLLLNYSDYRDIAYHFGVNAVHVTMKLGMVVYQEGRAGVWPPNRP